MSNTHAMKHALCLALALLCAGTRTHAQEINSAVYLGNGRTLTISAPEQLTFHARLWNFLARPGAPEIVYATSEINGLHITESVKRIGTDGKAIDTLLSLNPANLPFYEPLGLAPILWMGGGRYLLGSYFERLSNMDTSPENTVTVYDSIDLGVSPPKVRRIALPRERTNVGAPDYPVYVSPSGKLLAIGYSAPEYGEPVKNAAVFIYDAAADTLRRIPLPDGTELQDWIDDTHLQLFRHTPVNGGYLSRDIVTGKETPSDGTARQTPDVPRAFPDADVSFGPGRADLTVPRAFVHVAACPLWLRVTPTNRETVHTCLGVTVGLFVPQTALSSDGKAVLWLEHGDLFACALSVRAATTEESHDDGDVLSCAEQRALAEERVKTIGRDLLYGAQYGRGHLPTTLSFRDELAASIPNASGFAVAGHVFQYLAPDGLNLKQIPRPATFVLGKLFLSCTTVVLYADGHVKSLPTAKPGTIKLP